MTLEEVTRDTINSREEIKSNIERLLSQPTATEYTRRISEASHSLQQTHSKIQIQRKLLQTGSSLPFSN